MENPESKTRQCPICGGSTNLWYRGPLRSGSFGHVTLDDFDVLRCCLCGVGFLDNPPVIDYGVDDYRQAYNSSTAINDYFRRHDALQLEHLFQLRHHPLRGSVVADFGCGGGALLDFLKGAAKSTVAVEPFVGFHDALRAAGHLVYSTAPDAIAGGAPAVDIALSMHVIEHVDDPTAYLNAIRQTLAPNGRVIVATPNVEELLMALNIPEYERFYFRTAHRWYFSRTSLRLAAEAAGLVEAECRFVNTYDVSNVICWLRDRVPTGNGRLNLFDGRLDADWKAFLERAGLADSLWLEFVAKQA